jgi:hypothetical protein
MGQHLYDFSMFFGYLLDIILLVCSLIFCYRDANPKFIRIFSFFCFANILVDSCSVAVDHFTNGAHKSLILLCRLILTLILLLEPFFFAYLLFELIQSSLTKKITWILNFLFLVLFISALTSSLINKNKILGYTFYVLSNVVECGVMMILCFVFYRETLKKPYSKELIKLQSFWMVSGILFYFSLRVPAFLFSDYFVIKQKSQIAKAILSVYNFSQIIPYTFFIKAITCRTNQ